MEGQSLIDGGDSRFYFIRLRYINSTCLVLDLYVKSNNDKLENIERRLEWDIKNG